MGRSLPPRYVRGPRSSGPGASRGPSSPSHFCRTGSRGPDGRRLCQATGPRRGPGPAPRALPPHRHRRRSWSPRARQAGARRARGADRAAAGPSPAGAGLRAGPASGRRPSPRILQHVPAEIRVLREPGEPLADVSRIDRHGLALAVFGLEAQVLEQLLHHRLQPAGADVLDALVDLRGDLGDLADRVGGDLERDLLGADQRLVLLDEVGAGVAEDGDEVLLGQRLELDADRQAALELGEHVGRLRDVERAAGDEQHVVGLHRAVLGGDRGALDQRQQVALDALAADRAAAHVADGDLVDLVEKHDAVGLGVCQRDAGDVVLVHALLGFLVDQLVPRVGHLELAALEVLLAERLAHHLGQVDHLRAGAGDVERHRRRVLDLDLDLDLVHRILDHALAEAFAGCLTGVLADERLEQAVHRRLRRGLAHRLAAAVLLEPNRLFSEIAGDLLDVAADIADLGELGRLDLDERRVGELGEAPADLGLAAAGRPDHQDVLGRDLVAQLGAEAHAPPAVAQRHGDRALGLGLANDVLVERADNGFGGERVVHAVPEIARWFRPSRGRW